MFGKDHPDTKAMRFGWREAAAYAATSLFFMSRKRPRLPITALSRIRAMDVRDLPPTRHFTAGDGETLAYRTYSGGAERQLVMIHGSACFGDQMHGLALAIAKSNAATVHTLDMRGHGQNARGSASAERYALDAGEFCSQIRRTAGNSQIILAGHSAGGGLVLNVAAGPHMRDIDGILLLAPYLGMSTASTRPYFGGWLSHVKWPQLAMIGLMNLLGITKYNDRPLITFDREACLHDPRYVRDWSFDTLFGFGPGRVRPASDEMMGSKVPMILISGDQDECFFPERYSAVLDRIAPWASIQLFPGLGHWDILADKRVASFCVNWLDRHFVIEHQMQRGEFKDVKTA